MKSTLELTLKEISVIIKADLLNEGYSFLCKRHITNIQNQKNPSCQDGHVRFVADLHYYSNA